MTPAEREKLPYRTNEKTAWFGDDGLSQVSTGFRRSDMRRRQRSVLFLVTLRGRRQQAVPIEAVVTAIRHGMIPPELVRKCLEEAEQRARVEAEQRAFF